MHILATVPLPAWQAILLVLLSFASLLIALYCLLFMVPLKKFVQRIELLGGGMDGIKKHLNGLEDYFEKELSRIESNLADRLDSVRNDAEQRTGGLEQKYRGINSDVQKLNATSETLMETLQEMEEEFPNTQSRFQNIEARINELQRDISVLAQETEGKLNKEVRASYSELEASILSTLEVLRDELLMNTGGGRETGNDGQGKGATGKKRPPSYHNDENKIISAGPLFSRAPADDNKMEAETSEGGEAGDDEE